MTLLDIIIQLPKELNFKMHWLADCALLSEIFASKVIELEKHGPFQRRLVNMRGHEFTEEIIHLSENKLIYQIIGDGPVKHHRGEIQYISNSEQHCLHYQIQGQSNTWVPTWLLRMVMFYDFKLAANRLRAILNER